MVAVVVRVAVVVVCPLRLRLRAHIAPCRIAAACVRATCKAPKRSASPVHDATRLPLLRARNSTALAVHGSPATEAAAGMPWQQQSGGGASHQRRRRSQCHCRCHAHCLQRSASAQGKATRGACTVLRTGGCCSVPTPAAHLLGQQHPCPCCSTSRRTPSRAASCRQRTMAAIGGVATAAAARLGLLSAAAIACGVHRDRAACRPILAAAAAGAATGTAAIGSGPLLGRRLLSLLKQAANAEAQCLGFSMAGAELQGQHPAASPASDSKQHSHASASPPSNPRLPRAKAAVPYARGAHVAAASELLPLPLPVSSPAGEPLCDSCSSSIGRGFIGAGW